MTREKKFKILNAIEYGGPYSRNNRDMAILHANGYINATGVVNTSYINAKITLTEWGKIWLESEARQRRSSTN